MTYDPNAGNQNPWGQKPGDPNQPGAGGSQDQGQNQYGQDAYGSQYGQGASGQSGYGQGTYGQSGYAQDASGQQSGNQYGQYGQGASGESSDYGSYGASSTGATGDYPQNQAVYGSGGSGYGQGSSQQSYGYGQDASQQSGGQGQGGFGQGSYGQGGYGQDSYGQGGYNQGGYGQDASGQSGAYAAAGGAYSQPSQGSSKPKKSKGLLIGLIAGGVVVLLVVAGLIWEFAGRSSAGNTYVALLEEQGIEINGDTAEGDLNGSLVGGSYVFQSMGGTFSKVEVHGPELVANDVPYDVKYTLLGAPANGEGTIDRVRVDVHVPADAIMEVFFEEMDASDLDGVDMQLTSDGLTMTMEQFGSTTEMTLQITAVEGWMVMEITSMTLDGQDYTSELGSDVSQQVDPCEGTDYESYVTEAAVDEDGMHFQWEVDDVATADLAVTTCMA